MRPPAKSKVEYSDSNRNRVEARLWQDPFSAVQRFESFSGKSQAAQLSPQLQLIGEEFASFLANFPSCPQGADKCTQSDQTQLFLDCVSDPSKWNQSSASFNAEMTCEALADSLTVFRNYMRNRYGERLLNQALGVTPEIKKKEDKNFYQPGEYSDVSMADCSKEKGNVKYLMCKVRNSLVPDDWQNYSLHQEIAQALLTLRNRDVDLKIAEDIAANLEKGEKVLVMPVLLPGGDYADLVERRRRSRYAVIAALASRGYLPQDGTHIRVWNSPNLRCLFPSICAISSVPYEFFEDEQSLEIDNIAPSANRYKKVLIFWVNEDRISSTALPRVVKMFSLLEQYSVKIAKENNSDLKNIDELIDYRILGPYASSTFRNLFCTKMKAKNSGDSEALSVKQYYEKIDPHSWEDVSHRLEIINWSATSRRKLECTTDSSSGSLVLQPPERFISSTISSDSEMISKLAEEVLHRLGAKQSPFGELNESDGRRKSKETAAEARTGDVVLLISESDTIYSTSLNILAKNEFESAGFEVISQTYIRGIDGQYPGREDSENAQKPAQNGVSNTSLSQRLLRSGYLEPSSGTAQFDYLRRMAQSLVDRGVNVRAVGVLGSDVYDKLLVLQALRSTYPKAIYFTSDLYALYIKSNTYSVNRNLLVAASHSLDFPSAYSNKHRMREQRNWPPFRDSYQVSLFVAADYAISGSQSKPQAQPKIFEVGRGRIFELNSHIPYQDIYGYNQIGKFEFFAVHFIVAVCAIFLLLSFAKKAYGFETIVGKITGARRTQISILGGILVSVAFYWLSFVDQPAYGDSHYIVDVTPSRNDQAAAIICLFFLGIAILLLNSSHIGELFSLRKKDSRATQTVASESTRSWLSILLISSIALLYVTNWWLPLYFSVDDIWSMGSGVSGWPSFSISLLCVFLSVAAIIVSRHQVSILKAELHEKFFSKLNPKSTDEIELTKLWDKDLKKPRGHRRINYLILIAGVFLLFQVLDHSGHLNVALALRGGSEQFDIVQFLVVIAFGWCCITLYELGRNVRLMLEGIADQDEYSTIHINSSELDSSLQSRAPSLTEQCKNYWDREDNRHRVYQFRPAIKNAITDIQIIESVTGNVQKLFYFPVVILVLFVVAALPFFDGWPVEPPILFFAAAVTILSVHQAWRVNVTAHRVKSFLISNLQRRKSIAEVESIATGSPESLLYIRSFDSAIEIISNEHEGAFMPINELPLVRIILVTIGALGLILSQAIFGIGYSL